MLITSNYIPFRYTDKINTLFALYWCKKTYIERVESMRYIFAADSMCVISEQFCLTLQPEHVNP